MTASPPPTTLLLARHGQTVWHAENRYAGVSDVALTDEGGRQAERLGRWAARHPVDAVWTSTVSRAMATADPACRALGLVPMREHGLRECDFGVVEGRTLAEFAAEDPERAQAFRADPAANPFPGAEDPRRRRPGGRRPCAASPRADRADGSWSSRTTRCCAWSCASCWAFRWAPTAGSSHGCATRR